MVVFWLHAATQSDRARGPSILPAMSTPAAFLTHGLHQAGLALTHMMDLAGMARQPVTLQRTLVQKAMARLKQLEIIVRRLLTLMALALVLAPVRPRGAAVPKPDQAEPVCRKAAPGFSLTARLLSSYNLDLSGLFPCTIRASGPVPAALLLARLAALHDVLTDPAAHAKRLARSLARQRRRGEPKPCVLPMAKTYHLPTELSIIANTLPVQLDIALESWESSG
jgi:hypothetical protein